MAITAAALQTELGDNNFNLPRVIAELPPHGTAVQYWVIDGGIPYHKKFRKVTTTAADSAATQAAAVLTALDVPGTSPA